MAAIMDSAKAAATFSLGKLQQTVGSVEAVLDAAREAHEATLAYVRGPVGEIAAPIYTLELLGDATMVTVKAGGALVAIKAPKDFRAEIGDPVAARVPAAICHLFHPTTGERLSR